MEFSNLAVFFSVEVTACEKVEGSKYLLANFNLKYEVLLNKNTENEVEILYYERPTELKFEKNLAEGNHCLQTQYMCNTANPYYNFFGDSLVRILNGSCKFRQVFGDPTPQKI